MALNIDPKDKKTIAEIVADLATNAAVPPFRFFRNLIQQTNLSNQMRQELANIGQQTPPVDAWDLMDYARSRDVNPVDPRYTVLGSILQTVIDSDAYGLETRRSLAVIVVAYQLYRDDALLLDLMARFQIPQPARIDAKASGVAAKSTLSVPMSGAGGPVDVGPNIDWRETNPDLTLQSWPWSQPDYLDVGFLMRATERAAAVCRVEVPSMQRTGTGFLIAPDLLLTNYHVLCYNPGEDINTTAKDVTLRFGFITLATGGSASGETFKLAEKPILSSSPVAQLDYVLLQVESAVKNAPGIKPIRSIAKSLGADKSLNIIQHPEGDTLKIALSTDGVSGIYQDTGLIQYLSRAAGGSSGSPCFNDQWELIALHHAERARAFGSIREGILYSSIYDEISQIKQIVDLLPN